MYIHDNEVNNISKCNLLHDIINPPKHAKNINIQYSPILHGFMNTRKSTVKFKNLRILFNGGCSSTIVMKRLLIKLGPEKYSVMHWQTKAGNITNNFKVQVDLTLPALSATNVMT